ncbi:creatininase family protein [Ammoniphilus sp. YIM 78166]|uniref:creatininase family protein n=1 Tax=Ammoniphilus sp. YIM 78166 TaxID=1644106 RepID=UPI00106FCA6A|nr:creatininase family protein [Ammoniphilus sp. YIM 78166]
MNKMKVLWAELFPFEFKARLRANPTVYMPLGLCEPHGQISAFGLDIFKAEHICVETAKRMGGIVAPVSGYHIHETGPSARWLEEQVGETNPHMTSVAPSVFFRMLLYQLRAFYNAGFRSAMLVSGHGGAHTDDLRKVAGIFSRHTGMYVWYGTDFDLVSGRYAGDHAGKYEISTLMYLRPDLIDFTLRDLEKFAGTGCRLALAATASEASQDYGAEIMVACVDALSALVGSISVEPMLEEEAFVPLRYEQIENIWQDIVNSPEDWTCLHPRRNQPPVTASSRWKVHEYGKLE